MHVSMTQHFHIICSASKKHWIYSTLCNRDLHTHSQLDLSRDVELPEHLQTMRKAFAAAPLGFAVHT